MSLKSMDLYSQVVRSTMDYVHDYGQLGSELVKDLTHCG